MATRYIAVDSGKFATKIAEYDINSKNVNRFSIRTKMSAGDFRDDAIEDKTVVVEIDGITYKVGQGARGDGAALETSKMSDVHKICTLTALATIASENEEDELNVAIGLPAKDWANISTRMDFKDYMLPDGKISIAIKVGSSSNVVTKVFTIKKRFAFPESMGALMMDELADMTPTTVAGVVDIGNLNLNATLWQGDIYKDDLSTTAELGGAILIQELSQEISANIVPCNELIAANILKDKSGDRHLPDGYGLTEEQIDASRILIKDVIKRHVDKIKRCCNARGWSLNLMKIVAIGGTSKDIEEELREAFGNITVLPEPTYCNVYGYLRMMCAQLPEIGTVISLPNSKTTMANPVKSDKEKKVS